MKQLITCALSLLLLTSAAASDGVGYSRSAAELPSGIAGRVTDPSGALIVGAKVRVIARSTKKVFSLETDSDGVYAINLEPGLYDVGAEVAGFKDAERASIPVVRGARSCVDFVMELREASDPQHP